MSVLGVESKRKGYKLVGVHVPPQVHNYLTLSTLAKGVGKSTLFMNLIESWIEVEGSTEKVLIEQIIIRIVSEWKDKKVKHPRASFNEFKAKLRVELLDKGLTEKQVLKILPNIQE